MDNIERLLYILNGIDEIQTVIDHSWGEDNGGIAWEKFPSEIKNQEGFEDVRKLWDLLSDVSRLGRRSLETLKSKNKERMKNCPFCGHEAELEHEEPEVPTKEDWVRVVCQHCGGNSGWYLNDGMAIQSWNRREN